MKSIALALLVTLGSSTAFAQAPVQPRTERRNEDIWITGLLTEFAGGFVLGRGLATQHEIGCVAAGAFVNCVETGTEKGALIGIGAAAIAGGFAMALWGGKRVLVSPTRKGLMLSTKLTF